MSATLQSWARALGGEVRGTQVLCPGPGHSAEDRSLSVKIGKDGQPLVHSHADDDWKECRDYVLQRLRMGPFKPSSKWLPAYSETYEFRDPTTGDVRYRKERIECADGTKSSFFKPAGRNGCDPLLYGAECLADVTSGQPVFIVEGEKKVDRLRELGAVAVSADSGSSSKWLPPHADLLRGLPIILWPDSDESGEKYISRAARCLEDSAASIKVVRPFGPPNGAKGRDVCDWTGHAEDLAALAAGAEPYVAIWQDNGEAASPIKIYTYDEMLALPEASFVVEGVIVYRGKNVIFGVSNTFKSFHAVDLGCSVSTGRSYHGKAVKKMKVFYAANEGAIGIGRKRIAAWMAYHDIPQAERRNIFLIRDETIIPDEISRNNLLAAIRQLVEPGEDFFIIFDIHRGTMNAPDKDDDAADAWIKGAEILIKEGATILSLAHSPYSDDARARGSSHQWGSWDGRLQSEGDKEKRTSVLKVDRFKDHESTGQWGFTLEEQEIEEHPGEFSLVPRLDGTVKAGKAKPKKLPKNADLALSALKYALDEIGAIPPACNHIPANTKCVTVQQWREYSYMRSAADKTDTKLKSFVRGCECLSADGDGKIVAIWGAYAWLI
jgi:AAA domain